MVEGVSTRQLSIEPELEPRVAIGLLAEFETAEDLLRAARRAHAAGYRAMDAYSPFPIEGLTEALGWRTNAIPLIGFFGGLIGALTGIGFWAPTFYERHTTLTSSQASGVVGGLILVGALLGTLFGGWARDRIVARVAGASMVLSAATQAIGAVALMIVFLDVPLAVRLVFSVIGVAFIVAGFPALSATTADIVPARVRGLAFSVTGWAKTTGR